MIRSSPPLARCWFLPTPGRRRGVLSVLDAAPGSPHDGAHAPLPRARRPARLPLVPRVARDPGRVRRSPRADRGRHRPGERAGDVRRRAGVLSADLAGRSARAGRAPRDAGLERVKVALPGPRWALPGPRVRRSPDLSGRLGAPGARALADPAHPDRRPRGVAAPRGDLGGVDRDRRVGRRARPCPHAGLLLGQGPLAPRDARRGRHGAFVHVERDRASRGALRSRPGETAVTLDA